MSSYLGLRETLRSYLDGELPVPVTVHAGSFSVADINGLHLREGDELILALESAGGDMAKFQLYVKTRHAEGIPADVRALELILLAQQALHSWQSDFIAKRSQSTWQMLPDNTLAEQNVYLYRISIDVPILHEDYIRR